MYIAESLLTSVLGHMATATGLPRLEVTVNLWDRGDLRILATYQGDRLSGLDIRFYEMPGLSTFIVNYEFETGPRLGPKERPSPGDRYERLWSTKSGMRTRITGLISATGPGGTGFKHRVTAACQAMAFPPRFPERKRDTFTLLNRLVFEMFV